MKFKSRTVLIYVLFSCALLISISAALLLGQQKSDRKVAIAISNIEISNISPGIAKQIYDRLCQELNDSKKVRILSKVEFSSSAYPLSPEKIIKTDKSMKTQKVLTGMIGKMGSSFIISLKLIDTKDSKNNKSMQSTKEYNGSLEIFLSNTVPTVVKQILQDIN